MTTIDIDHLTPAEQTTLTNALTNVTTWIGEALNDAITRQDRHTTGPKVGGTRDTALPFNDAASETNWILRNTLNAWITETATDRHYPHPGRLDTIPAARWLKRHIIAIAISTHARTAYTEILDAINQASRHLNRPQRPDLLGPCTHCGADLWAHHDTDPIACRACAAIHHRHDIDTRLEAQVRDRILTVRDIAAIATDLLQRPITPKAIYELTRRRHITLTPHAPNTRGERRYRTGDILDALTKPTPKRQRQHARTEPGT